MNETTSVKGMREKSAEDLSIWRCLESVRLIAKGTAHEHCTLVDKVVSHQCMD